MTLIELLTQSSIQQLIYSFLLPFLLIFAILWGILTALKVFDKKVNLIIALIATVLISSTDYFILISTYFSQLGASVAVFAFFALFIYGAIVWAIGKGRGIYYEHMEPTKKMKKINEDIEKLYVELDKAKHEGNQAKVRALRNQIEDLRREKEEVRREEY